MNIHERRRMATDLRVRAYDYVRARELVSNLWNMAIDLGLKPATRGEGNGQEDKDMRRLDRALQSLKRDGQIVFGGVGNQRGWRIGKSMLAKNLQAGQFIRTYYRRGDSLKWEILLVQQDGDLVLVNVKNPKDGCTERRVWRAEDRVEVAP